MNKLHSLTIIKEAKDESPQIIAEKALDEFHNLKNKIEEKGIKITSLKRL